ncbi:hypothetical protein [Streptomyces collinus]|uniref:hypothetical protein n=1 Tax=Streptomyces collinus TaxID=42684 RepID=UPI0038004565
MLRPAAANGARSPPAAEQKVPMSDELTPAPDDFGTWLSERGPDAYALAWVSEATGAVSVAVPRRPRWGRAGSPAPAPT